MTLTEFLLERIAEDEAEARVMMREYERGGDVSSRRWRRAIAECEAKRRILAQAVEATGLDLQVDSEFRVGERDTATEPYCGDLILRALGLPYADHPDFRDEWRA